MLSGPIVAPAAMSVRPCSWTFGLERDVGSQRDLGVDPAGRRVDHPDARAHVPLQQPLVVDAVRRGQLHPVVDAGGLLGRRGAGAHVPALGDEDADHLGQVLLALGVVGAQPADRLVQQAGVEGVDPGRHLGHRQLVRAGVLLLHHPQHGAGPAGVAGPDHPAVAGRVGQLAGQHGGSGAAGGVLRQQAGQGGRQQQRRVAGQHQHSAGDRPVGGELLQRYPDGVPGAVLLLLHHRHRRRGDLGQVGGDLVAAVPNHHGGPLGGQAGGGCQRVSRAATGRRRDAAPWAVLADFIRLPSPAASTTMVRDGRVIEVSGTVTCGSLAELG